MYRNSKTQKKKKKKKKEEQHEKTNFKDRSFLYAVKKEQQNQTAIFAHNNCPRTYVDTIDSL